MKMTKIRIRNFRGLEALDVAVPPAGLIAKGGNAKGKTSFLKAVRSALEARDISADAIRLGADRAELLVDFDHVTVKRTITAKKSDLVVERDGLRAPKPTAFLKDLLGASSLDPLDLYLAKPKERRALILAALPCTVTRDQLAKYAPQLPADFDASGHGLDVIERAHRFVYDERTLANKEAADAAKAAEHLAAEAEKAAGAVTPGPVLALGAAEDALAEATRSLTALETRKRDAVAALERTAAQRVKVEEIRARAAELEKQIGDELDLDPVRAERDARAAEVADLERKLEAARMLLRAAEEKIVRGTADNAENARRAERVADLRSQASALETALAAAGVEAPSEQDEAAARSAVEKARAAVARADAQDVALRAAERAEAAKQEAAEFAADAAALDATVKRLAKDAPNDLLTAADGIPGLTLSGDEVFLDGKSLDALSGAEQLRFAVEIARRANARTKILVVDGLERLDRDQLDVFVAHATRDDWQLLGSLVTGGELVVAAIEPDVAAAAE